MPSDTASGAEPASVGELARALSEERAPGRKGADIREKLPPVLGAGFRMAGAVLGLIAFFSAAGVGYWMLATPAIAEFGSPVTAESLALWQKASDLVFQRITTLFDQVVIKVLLPVLTLLLGYVFGARAGQPPPPENGGG